MTRVQVARMIARGRVGVLIASCASFVAACKGDGASREAPSRSRPPAPSPSPSSPSAAPPARPPSPPAPPPLPTDRQQFTSFGMTADVRVPIAWTDLAPDPTGFTIADSNADEPAETMGFHHLAGVDRTPEQLARGDAAAVARADQLLLPPTEAAPGRWAAAMTVPAHAGQASCAVVEVWWRVAGEPFHCVATSCGGRWHEYLGLCLDAKLGYAPPAAPKSR